MRCFRVRGSASQLSVVSVFLSAFNSGAGAAPAAMIMASNKLGLITVSLSLETNFGQPITEGRWESF